MGHGIIRIHARLFAFREGGHALKNKIFRRKSAAERRRYLSAVLRHGVGGALSEEEIDRILSEVSLNRQYAVSIFLNHISFRETLARILTEENKTFMSVVFSRGGHRRAPVAVIVTSAERNGTKREILVLAPKYIRKGEKHEQKRQKPGRV
jgi:hypothetical protein